MITFSWISILKITNSISPQNILIPMKVYIKCYFKLYLQNETNNLFQSIIWPFSDIVSCSRILNCSVQNLDVIPSTWWWNVLFVSKRFSARKCTRMYKGNETRKRLNLILWTILDRKENIVDLYLKQQMLKEWNYQLNCMGKIERKFVCKWLSDTMVQKYNKGCTFYWDKLFELDASNICFKMNISAGFTHKGYVRKQINFT